MKRMVTENDIEKIAEEVAEKVAEEVAEEVVKDVVINDGIIEGDTGISVEPNSGGDALRVGIDLTGGEPGKVLGINAAGTDVEWTTVESGGGTTVTTVANGVVSLTPTPNTVVLIKPAVDWGGDAFVEFAAGAASGLLAYIIVDADGKWWVSTPTNSYASTGNISADCWANNQYSEHVPALVAVIA